MTKVYQELSGITQDLSIKEALESRVFLQDIILYMAAHHLDWRGHTGFTQSAHNAEYYPLNPPARTQRNAAAI